MSVHRISSCDMLCNICIYVYIYIYSEKSGRGWITILYPHSSYRCCWVQWVYIWSRRKKKIYMYSKTSNTHKTARARSPPRISCIAQLYIIYIYVHKHLLLQLAIIFRCVVIVNRESRNRTMKKTKLCSTVASNSRVWCRVFWFRCIYVQFKWIYIYQCVAKF